MKWWMSIALLVSSGCSFLAPGYDTRQALLAKNSLHWGADGDAQIVDETTHNGTTILAESSTEQGLSVTPGADGTPPTISGASGVFYRQTDPKDAASTYIKLAEENAKAWTATMGAVLAAMQQHYDYRLQQQSQGNDADAARWERIMSALERLAPSTQPE